MKLKRTIICNFRSIEELRIEFNPTCRVLVGINESGKSNILKALSLLDEETEIDPNDIRELKPDEAPHKQAYVRFEFALDTQDRAVAVKALKLKFKGNLDSKIIAIGGKKLTLHEFVDTINVVLIEVDLLEQTRGFSYYGLSTSAETLAPWIKLQTHIAAIPPAKPTYETLIVEKQEQPLPNQKYSEFIPSYLNWLVCNAFEPILKEKYPDVVLWKYSESHLLPGKIESEVFKKNPDSCLPLKHMFIMAGETDIPNSLELASNRTNGMRNLLKRVAQVATKHLHQVWKEYKGIEFELLENGEFIDAHILDKFNVYDLSRRSDGFKRFVSFLLHISANAKSKQLTNTLYLDDEPDIGLHPSGARHLRNELIKISKDNYVVYATHSIFMIDGENLERHLIVSKINEITQVEVASQSNFTNEEVIFNALGYSMFEHLSANNIVFEGWRDKRLFEIALNSSRQDVRDTCQKLRQVGLCFARGVKDIGRVTAMLELAKRTCTIISDSDKPAKEQQSTYKGYGNWLRYDQLLATCSAVTGEDFVVFDSFKSILVKLAEEFPKLGPIPEAHEFIGKDNLKIITKWLEKGGFPADEIKIKINSIKEDVFANLKPSHITESYFLMIKALEIVLFPVPESTNGSIPSQ